ncbi:oxidoreductase domain protein [Candidatus Vecturithrix granuli]|uniref:Oxidoreductase domain protein n=1 Tax=Vecturithrix granuli TaxID=1499967 RepID=A0A081BX72_VECG1|nr:oxidoreductase domain protein [Candidatus Vecturithrix granuli]
MEDKKKYFRIGFVGAGTHANNMLYPSLTFLDDFEVERVAVCDLSEEKARKVASNFGVAHVYTNHQEMFAKEKLDGVVVCINAKGHPPVVRDALQADLDVFCEKPTSITVEESEELAELSRKTGRFVMVDHQKRRATAYQKALEIVKSPSFGKVTMVEAKMHGHIYDNLFNCMMEWQIHNIDIVRAFAGDVKEIVARMCRLADNRASIAILLTFENGAVATLNWGSEAGGKGRFCERIEVVGSNDEAVIVENVRHVIHYKEDESKEWAPNWVPILKNQTTVIDGYVGNLREFMNCVLERRQPVPNIEDEVRALRVIYAIAEQLGIPAEWTITIGDR